MRHTAARALLFLILFGLAPALRAQNQTIIFSAMGDVPYSSSEVPILRTQIQNHNKYSPSEFMVHVGDIKSGSQACSQSWYRMVATDLKVLAVPTFIIPGDNEWNGCSNPDQGWGWWFLYFNEFETNFCGAPVAERQSVRHENFAFVKKGVLFIGINLVSSPVLNQTQWNQRLQQDADWVKAQFQAKVGQVRAAVVFSQSGPGSIQNLFFNQFRTAAATFAKPVLTTNAAPARCSCSAEPHRIAASHPGAPAVSALLGRTRIRVLRRPSTSSRGRSRPRTLAARRP